MWVVVFFAAHWYLSLFTQTFFNHRYAAHQQFTMKRGWERVFYFLTYILQGSSYLSPRAYGVMHRLHHAYADTEKDVHSPKYSKNLFDMMWKTKNNYSDVYYERLDLPEKFTKNVPRWDALDRFGESWVSRIMFGAIYTGVYYLLGAQWWMYLTLLPIQFIMGPFHGAIINWYAHRVGYRNHKVNDTSTNLMPIDIFMMGEGYHNNHHTYSGRANFGMRWHEVDPTYLVIVALNAMHVIRLGRNREQPAVAA